MRHPLTRPALLIALSLGLSACGETATQSVADGTGPDPKLPPPNKTLIPTVKVAEIKEWPQGSKPAAAQGLVVTEFASGLVHPRWLLVLPNGDVLVAESDGPDRPDQRKGVRGWLMSKMMERAGSGTPSADRITLLRDADGDGVAEMKAPFIENLHSPFGMALVGDSLYIANTDALVRFPYQEGQTRIDTPPEKIVDLPGGPLNHHWTKNVIASPDGQRLYVTVGSNSNVGENGLEKEEGRAAIWEVDPAGKTQRLYAWGLRNPNGLDWEPTTGKLWTVVNERDEIGSDLVPDYMTSVQDGGFYGWPYSYFGQIVDERVEPKRPDLVAKAIKPDYALGPHTASLGLTFAKEGQQLGPAFGEGVFIGQHGSWNRKPPSGYKVVFIPFQGGMPQGMPVDVLSGFLDEEGNARGRPVDVRIDTRGGLLVTDDAGNRVWRVTGQAAAP